MTTTVDGVVEEVSPGWHIRRATEEDDWSSVGTPEAGKLYWVRFNTDGRVTKVCASPGQTIQAAAEMDEAAAASETRASEDARPKILSELETEQRARWPRLNELTEKAVGDVWLSEEESEEFERLGGEYEGAYDAALEALGGDANAVREVRDRVEQADARPEAEEPPADAADTPSPAEPVGTEPPRAPAMGLFFTSPDAPPALSQEMLPARITTHPSTLMRAGGLHAEHVADLEAVLRSGGKLPPVDVFFDGSTHWLADGNHRHAAALRAEALLDVNVHKGSLRDAVLFAVRSNAAHGLKRSNDDKRLAVVTLLADEEWGRQSDTSVASLADVTQPFVGKVQTWLVKLLPVLGGDGVEDPSDVPDEEFAARADVPEGLVSAVRGLTDAQLASLSNNVMARAESRTSKDGKQFSVERPAADEPPPLLAGTVSPQEPASDAQEAAEEAGEAEASTAPVREEEQGGEEIVVTDRRRFADELPAHVTSTLLPSQPAPAAAPAPAAPQQAAQATKPDRWAEIERRLKGRALVVMHTLMPKGLGAMITVNISGAPPADAVNSKLFPVEKVMRLGDEEFEIISQRLDTEKTKPKAAKKAAAKSAKKAAAKARPSWAGSSDGPGRCRNCDKLIAADRTHTHTAKGKCAEYVIPAKGGSKKAAAKKPAGRK